MQAFALWAYAARYARDNVANNMQSQQVPRARTRAQGYNIAETLVFNIPELLERILSHFDMRTLLFSQQVNRQFQACIRHSHHLQRLLFFEKTQDLDPGPDVYDTSHGWGRYQRTCTNYTCTAWNPRRIVVDGYGSVIELHFYPPDIWHRHPSTRLSHPAARAAEEEPPGRGSAEVPSASKWRSSSLSQAFVARRG